VALGERVSAKMLDQGAAALLARKAAERCMSAEQATLDGKCIVVTRAVEAVA